MKLVAILEDLFADSVLFDHAIDIKGIAIDSRKVKKGFLFLAIKGSKEHGLVYLQQAIDKGAIFVIYEPRGSAGFELKGHCLAVKDLASKLGIIAHRFYHLPSKSVEVIGVTGTNGKTTASQFIAQLIPQCGVIGTLGWGEKKSLQQTVNTTPDALTVHEILACFVSLKKQRAVMEVSSHGLQQGRVNAVVFKGAVFTNLTRDHLDYHGSMEQYIQAKLALFKQSGLEFVVVNTDDSSSERFLAVVDEKVKCWAFSVIGNQSQWAENITVDAVVYSLNGIKFIVCWRNERVKVETGIVGDFNLENILAAMTVLLALGYSLVAVASQTSQLVPVKGRMEKFGGDDKPLVFVDYAHTPDALKKVLCNLRKHCQRNLALVFGCGGNRDQGKRKQMGVIAENLADQVIITNDNPRNENAENIISDILTACSNKVFEVIQDREQAILSIISQAKKDDCVVIAGKGHEDYQEIKGIRQAFKDQDVVKHALLKWVA